MRMFVCFTALMFLVISSTNSMNWVSHDLLLQKPCCRWVENIVTISIFHNMAGNYVF